MNDKSETVGVTTVSIQPATDEQIEEWEQSAKWLNRDDDGYSSLQELTDEILAEQLAKEAVPALIARIRADTKQLSEIRLCLNCGNQFIGEIGKCPICYRMKKAEAAENGALERAAERIEFEWWIRKKETDDWIVVIRPITVIVSEFMERDYQIRLVSVFPDRLEFNS